VRVFGVDLSPRKSAPAIVILAMALGLSGCLYTSGHPVQANPNPIDGPDPAATPTGSTTAEIYTTSAENLNIPTWNWNLSTHAQVGSFFGDALPTRPSWNTAGNGGVRVWAPTVRAVAGRYLMFWSGSDSQHPNGNCLGAATSSSVSGPFTGVTSGEFAPWCPGPDKVEFLDPQLFFDPQTGLLWLYFSRQDHTNGSGVATGDIDAVQLSSNGLSRVGTVYTLETYSTVAAHFTCAGHLTYPRLENPAMVFESRIGSYVLLTSFGSFVRGDCYETVEVTCSAPNSGCNSGPNDANVVNLAGDQNVTQTGGAAMVNDLDSGNGDWIVFAGYTPTSGGKRIPYEDSTTCFFKDPSSGNVYSC